MKKITLLVVLCSVVLASCLETITNTQINKNGSGTMLASIDFSTIMQMVAGDKSKGQEFKLDTTIHLRDHTDTASLLTAEQKRLLRDMNIKISIAISDANPIKFVVGTETTFKSLEDLTALGELMKTKEYDTYFDRAMKIPMFADKDKDDEQNPARENDNIFASIFPDFFHCVYTKNSISCRLDTAEYRRSMQEMEKNEFDITMPETEKMFSTATFTQMITLPSGVKELKGVSIKKNNVDNMLIQTGSLLDLYKHPENYQYSVKY